MKACELLDKINEAKNCADVKNIRNFLQFEISKEGLREIGLGNLLQALERVKISKIACNRCKESLVELLNRFIGYARLHF